MPLFPLKLILHGYFTINDLVDAEGHEGKINVTREDVLGLGER